MKEPNFHCYVQERCSLFVEVVHQLEQEIYHDSDFEMVLDLLMIDEVEMHKHFVNPILEYYNSCIESYSINDQVVKTIMHCQ